MNAMTAQAQHFCDIINGATASIGRPLRNPARIIARRGDRFEIFGAETARGKYLLAEACDRVVGVYAPGVTTEDIERDMKVMA